MITRTVLISAFLALGAPAQDRTAWFREAKFGMFIHWGPYSQASVEASWPIMTPSRHPGIGEPEYRALANTFNPVRYDPAAWVKLARRAGQRYMVFTSKHHDGFCMFDSAYTGYKVTNSPYKKDVAGMLADACRDARMPLGFYYSPPDMNHPGYRDTSKPASSNWRGEATRVEWPLYLDYMELQLRELMTRYGDVAILWFDGLGGGAYDPYRMHRAIRDLQPKALINNRAGIPGDYETPEQFVPKARPDRLFEVCMTINGTWGYNKNDTRYKSATHLIRTLIDVVSKGGNFLLNVGPTPEGEIQPEFAERLEEMGRWLSANGEAIYGTTAGPWQDLGFARTTAKGNRVYLHVFDWPATDLKVAGVAGRVVSVMQLAGGRRLEFRQDGGTLTVRPGAVVPDAHATVLAIVLATP